MAPDYIKQLLSAGCAMRIQSMAVENLISLAQTARASGVTLTIVGAMAPASMLKVIEAGGGSVSWDIAVDN